MRLVVTYFDKWLITNVKKASIAIECLLHQLILIRLNNLTIKLQKSYQICFTPEKSNRLLVQFLLIQIYHFVGINQAILMPHP